MFIIMFTVIQAMLLTNAWWCDSSVCTFRDIAVIDSNGYGQIVGRMKDMIIRGGENIYPRLDAHLINLCTFFSITEYKTHT